MKTKTHTKNSTYALKNACNKYKLYFRVLVGNHSSFALMIYGCPQNSIHEIIFFN